VAIVRNPGGRAAGAIKALAGMQAVLNCGTIIVVHHTGKLKAGNAISDLFGTYFRSDCGMTHVSDQEVRDHLMSIAPETKEKIENTNFGEIRVP
jgi:carbonic anhydrase